VPLIIAGFVCFLAITAPVRGPDDLAPVSGTVKALSREEDGTLVITLDAPGPALRILESDQAFLDKQAFRREVRPGSPVTALVIAARLRDGSSPLTVFGLAGQTGDYLPPEPLVAGRALEAPISEHSASEAMEAQSAVVAALQPQDVPADRLVEHRTIEAPADLEAQLPDGAAPEEGGRLLKSDGSDIQGQEQTIDQSAADAIADLGASDSL
jgi:hypothetical protein